VGPELWELAPDSAATVIGSRLPPNKKCSNEYYFKNCILTRKSTKRILEGGTYYPIYLLITN
jgi:hypothetical protein